MAEETNPQILYGIIGVANSYINIQLSNRTDVSLSAIKVPGVMDGVAFRGLVSIPTPVAATITVNLYRGFNGSAATPANGISSLGTITQNVLVGVPICFPIEFVDGGGPFSTDGVAGQYSIGILSSVAQTSNASMTASARSW